MNVISYYHTILDSLLSIDQLPDSLIPKVIFLKADLSMMADDTVKAIENLSATLEKDKDFMPALIKLMQVQYPTTLNAQEDLMRRLLFRLIDSKPIDIVKNYKPL